MAASSPIIWEEGQAAKMLNTGPLMFNDGTEIWTYAGDPNGVLDSTVGSLVLDTATLTLWRNTGSTNLNEWVADIAIANATNSGVTLSLGSNNTLSATINGSNIDHNSLASLNGNSNALHLTGAEYAALHPAVTIANDSNAGLTLSMDTNQQLTIATTKSMLSPGPVTLPAFTNNGDGTITVASGAIANFYPDSNSLTGLVQLTETNGAPSLTITDGGTTFIYLDYNAGSPVFAQTDVPGTFFNRGDYVALFRCTRSGTSVYVVDYDKYGVNLAAKSMYKDLALHSTERQTGLVLSTAATRIATITSGTAWFGVTQYPLPELISGTFGTLYYYYLVAGVWNKTAVNLYDSQYYSDGVNQQTLGNSKWVAKYFYRMICTNHDEMFYISGTQSTSQTEAFNEAVPIPPTTIASQALYVGKIVIQQAATNGTAYPRNWNQVLLGAPATSHEELNDISGGATANHQHFARYATVALAKAATGSEGDVIYVTAKDQLYTYVPVSLATADDDLILTTSAGGTTRWEALQKLVRSTGDNGWIDSSGATITKLNATTVRLTMASAGIFAIKGVRVDIPIGTYDVVLSGAAGLKFIGFDDETLVLKQQDSLWNFDAETPVSASDWNGTAIISAPQTEFHTARRNTVTHSYMHRYLGLQYRSGLTFTGNVQADTVNNPGADDTVFYLWSTMGIVQDEDIEATPGTGQWLQTLGSGLASGTAAIFNFLYFNGVITASQAAMADRSPFIHAGAGTAPQWNNVGTLTAGITGDYIVYHYFACPKVGGWSVFSRPHNAKFTDLSLARTATPTTLTWEDYAEIKHIYTAVFRVNTTWSNTHLCKLVSLQSYRLTPGTPIGATGATDHNALSNRAASGSHPASAISVDALAFSGVLTTTDTDVQTALATISSVAQRKDSIGATIAAATEKTTLADADLIPLADSAAGFVLKEFSVATLKSQLGTGLGIPNYVLNPNAESSVTDSITFGAGVVAPIASPTALVGDNSFRVTGIATAGSTTWWQWTMDAIDPFFINRPLSFEMKTSASLASAFKVAIYNVTDATELSTTVVTIPGGLYVAKGFFIPVSGKTYAMRVTQILNGTNTCDIDDLFVGDEPVRYAAGRSINKSAAFAFLDSEVPNTGTICSAFNTVFSNDSSTISKLSATQVQIKANVKYKVTLQMSCTFDLATSNAIFHLRNVTAATNFTKRVVLYPPTTSGNTQFNTYTEYYVLEPVDTILSVIAQSVTGGCTIRGDSESIISIEEMEVTPSNIQLGDRAVEEFSSNYNTASGTASDSTSFAYGPDGSLIPNGTLGTLYVRTVKFLSPNQPTDTFAIEVNTGTAWADIASVNGALVIQGANVYGAGFSTSTTDTINVVFYLGGVSPSGATYAANGSPWSGLYASGTKWRVRRVSGGAQVGYPIASQNIVGRIDGAAPASRQIGEVVTLASSTAAGAGSWVAGTSMGTVASGVWLLRVKMQCTKSVASGRVDVMLSSNNTGDSSGSLGDTATGATYIVSGDYGSMNLSAVINSSGSTAIYPKSVGNVSATATGTLTRIA